VGEERKTFTQKTGWMVPEREAKQNGRSSRELKGRKHLLVVKIKTRKRPGRDEKRK